MVGREGGRGILDIVFMVGDETVRCMYDIRYCRCEEKEEREGLKETEDNVVGQRRLVIAAVKRWDKNIYRTCDIGMVYPTTVPTSISLYIYD